MGKLPVMGLLIAGRLVVGCGWGLRWGCSGEGWYLAGL